MTPPAHQHLLLQPTALITDLGRRAAHQACVPTARSLCQAPRLPVTDALSLPLLRPSSPLHRPWVKGRACKLPKPQPWAARRGCRKLGHRPVGSVPTLPLTSGWHDSASQMR